MFSPIPLPNMNDNHQFNDVMDFYQTMKARKAQQAQFEQEMKLKQEQLNFNKQMQPLKLDLLRAQIEGARNRPEHLGGVAGEIEDLEKLKQKYGENSFQYKLAERAFNSQVTSRESLSNMRDNPNRFAPAQVKNVTAFQDQIKKDFPQYSDEEIGQVSDAYLAGKDEVNGKKLPPLSATANALLNPIYKGSSTTAIQNQAANLNSTYNELKNIDIEPLKDFAGAEGKVKYLYQKANPSSRTQSWRDYDAFKTSTQILAMDTLRKGFGTSVVPEYVYSTLGQLSNPNSSIWDDPEQVQTRWNKTLEWLQRASKSSTKQARFGATVSLDDEGSDNSSSADMGTTIMYKNGKKYSIPNAEVEEAKAAGYSNGR